MKKKVKVLCVILAMSMMATFAMGSGSSGGSSSSSSSSKKCAYKEGGVEFCNSPAASGSNFCSYHTKYLDDAYNILTGK